MDADGLEDETPPLDRFHAEDSFSLSQSAPTAFQSTVVLPPFFLPICPLCISGQYPVCLTLTPFDLLQLTLTICYPILLAVPQLCFAHLFDRLFRL